MMLPKVVPILLAATNRFSSANSNGLFLRMAQAIAPPEPIARSSRTTSFVKIVAQILILIDDAERHLGLPRLNGDVARGADDHGFPILVIRLNLDARQAAVTMKEGDLINKILAALAQSSGQGFRSSLGRSQFERRKRLKEFVGFHRLARFRCIEADRLERCRL